MNHSIPEKFLPSPPGLWVDSRPFVSRGGSRLRAGVLVVGDPQDMDPARAAFEGAGGTGMIFVAARGRLEMQEALKTVSQHLFPRALVLLSPREMEGSPEALGSLLHHAGRTACEAGTVVLMDAPGEDPASAARLIQDAGAELNWRWKEKISMFFPALGLGRRGIPASAAVAGALVRGEEREGPWGPVSRVAGVCLGKAVPKLRLGVFEEQSLRTAGINPIRVLHGVGAVSFGDSTLSLSSLASEIARVAVIRELHLGLQWAAFEVDGPRLRAQVRREATAVLRRAWESGVLDGETPSQAFAVALAEAPHSDTEGVPSPPRLTIWMRPARSMARIHISLQPGVPSASGREFP